MVMTPEDLRAMTLGDLEVLAGRMEIAARTIRDAMTLLGGPPQTGAVVHTAPFIQPIAPQIAPPHQGIAPLSHQAAVKQERLRWLAEQRQSAERQEKLAQFRHDFGKEDEKEEMAG